MAGEKSLRTSEPLARKAAMQHRPFFGGVPNWDFHWKSVVKGKPFSSILQFSADRHREALQSWYQSNLGVFEERESQLLRKVSWPFLALSRILNGRLEFCAGVQLTVCRTVSGKYYLPSGLSNSLGLQTLKS